MSFFFERNFSLQKLPEIVIRYSDAYHYKRIFLPLIQQEAETDRKLKEAQLFENITIRWDTGLNKRQIAYINLPRVDADAKIMPGDELRLTTMDRAWDGVGNVLKVPDNSGEELSLQLKLGTKNIPVGNGKTFRVECVWKSTSFDRMKSALTTFAIDGNCMSNFIYNTLLGSPLQDTPSHVVLPRRITGPNLSELNTSQVQAVRKAISSQISLIQVSDPASPDAFEVNHTPAVPSTLIHRFMYRSVMLTHFSSAPVKTDHVVRVQ